MTSLLLLLLAANLIIAYHCYYYAVQKGYPIKFFGLLGLVPYFNLVVWVYLLFLPDVSEPGREHKQKQPL